MDSLLEEINRKRKQLDENEITSNKKYYRRGDLLAQEEQQILKEREEIQKKEKEALEANNDFLNNDKNTEKNDGSNEKDIISMLPTEEISREQVIKRLRDRNAPIRLFGETDQDSCQRLKIIKVMEKEDNEGLRNDFQAALEKLENSYFPGCEDLNNEVDRKDLRFKEIPVEKTINEIKEMNDCINKGDLKVDCTVVLSFIKNMMNIWARDLNQKVAQERINIKIRMEGARFEQTKQYLEPLLFQLKNMALSPELMNSLTQITFHCLDGNYVKANDVYLQMAIGNAPWPIGVTMVGIHARTGRERIFSRHVAHVLNDETQRKYIQGFKRLMTLCQKKFPSDPSKSVEFGGTV